MKIAIKIIIFLFLTLSFYSKVNALSIIRDSEIEEFLYQLTAPIIKVAGLNEQNIKIYIVNDNAVNAFVSGGQNIFINTGLLTKYQDPNIILGVLAHEIGHIAAGHLARGGEEIKKAENLMILTYIGSIIAAIGSDSDAGYATLMGGNQIAERIFLKYNRSQEEAADILALKYLAKTNNSPNGLLTILEFFKSQMLGQTIIDEYAFTHPISQKRINFIKANLQNSDVITKNQGNSAQNYQMQRIIAKLQGFLGNSEQILQNLQHQEDFFSNYQKAIALFKSKEISKSLKIIDQLLQSWPKDAYLLELKAQILYESGLVKEAIIFYKKSLDIKGNNALAKIEFAKAIINLDSSEPKLIKFAIKNLKSALQSEKDNLQIYQNLSIAYEQISNMALAKLSLAKFYLIKKDYDNAKKYAKESKDLLLKDSLEDILKANDIIEFAKLGEDDL